MRKVKIDQEMNRVDRIYRSFVNNLKRDYEEKIIIYIIKYGNIVSFEDIRDRQRKNKEKMYDSVCDFDNALEGSSVDRTLLKTYKLNYRSLVTTYITKANVKFLELARKRGFID